MLAMCANDHGVCVGVIASSSGVRGNVKIRSFTDNPEDISTFQKVYDFNLNTYKIEVVQVKKDYIIASIDGVNNRDQAEQLRNIRLFINRAELPEPSEEEYYHADLIGMSVYDTDNINIGTVVNLVNFGASDILEVQTLSDKDTVYYPFAKQWVESVDQENRKILLKPQEETIAADE